MATPILKTKLYMPPARSDLISRPRLTGRLNTSLPEEGAGLSENCFARKLTLISAPAGFGKTTLMSEWVHTVRAHRDAPLQAAWLSLDEGDNDPVRFLTYLIAALQTVEGNVGNSALSALQSPQPPPIEALLAPLINDIVAITGRIVLVLDDYHVIEAQAIHDTLTFLLEHLPPQMHLVIATREDPYLPLARLRVRGQLTEVRVTDLRFTLDEAAEFLSTRVGLNLSAEDIAALETRTEGWIAGLQLAAISMQGYKDATSFIKSFTGSHHFVLDYLLEEVLHQQPESVQTFLLRSSILDRMCGSLCDAVRFGGAKSPTAASGQETLEYLERANLFIIPLDSERRWYRYHHLFADLLRQRLQQSVGLSTGGEKESVAELHSRASLWYEENGFETEAFHHAFAAEDFERAASLAELAWQTMDSSFQSAAWLGWVKKLPDKLIRARPVLSTQYAWALNDVGEVDAVEARLLDAERWLDTTGDIDARPEGSLDEMVVVDEELFQTLPWRIALARAVNAQVRGDVAATVEYAKRALDLISEEDHYNRSLATSVLAFTHWANGDLEAVNRAFADFRAQMLTAGNVFFAVACSGYLAEIMVAQGRLHEAERTYKQSLQLASEHGEQLQRVTAHLHLGLAMLYHEMGDREAAAQQLLKSKELGEQTALIDWPHRWCLAQARLKEAEGGLEAALDLLDEAKRLYVRNPVPDERPIEALKARVYVKQGRLTQALDWVHEHGLSVDDDLSYLREFEHITLARVLIAEYQSDCVDHTILAARGLLERLLKVTEEGGRMGSMIEILVLQALAHQAQGNIPLALAPLERALALAEPAGYVRIFVDEGLPMAQLLSEAVAREVVSDYTGKLLAVFRSEEQKSKAEPCLPPAPPARSLVEPLSQRELEVLQLIAQGLSNREISERLFLALSTVKGHNRNIFGKLQVQRRTEAVARARELGLV
jgi:LuxR family maltose regulon positive regulatory protein